MFLGLNPTIWLIAVQKVCTCGQSCWQHESWLVSLYSSLPPIPALTGASGTAVGYAEDDGHQSSVPDVWDNLSAGHNKLYCGRVLDTWM